jgi:hypothetical protein
MSSLLSRAALLFSVGDTASLRDLRSPGTQVDSSEKRSHTSLEAIRRERHCVTLG